MSTRITFFMFTAVNGRAAKAASEKRRMTSVNQSTLVWSSLLSVRVLLQASTGDRGEKNHKKGAKCHGNAVSLLSMAGNGDAYLRQLLKDKPMDKSDPRFTSFIRRQEPYHKPSASVKLLMMPRTSTVLSPPRSSISKKTVVHVVFRSWKRRLGRSAHLEGDYMGLEPVEHWLDILGLGV